tara:strand:- start:918 stop:1202 length:285 start_codon:yes stop_codon:yes gene_type:complete
MFNTQLSCRYIAHAIAALHLIVYVLNIVSIPLVIIYEPFYIWMPFITFFVSPLLGGVYCMFNRLENVYRQKAGMPLIEDRFAEFLWHLMHRSKK